MQHRGPTHMGFGVRCVNESCWAFHLAEGNVGFQGGSLGEAGITGAPLVTLSDM